MIVDRLLTLAQMLLDEGYVDNEPDARLAALDILLAAGVDHATGNSSEPEQEPA